MNFAEDGQVKSEIGWFDENEHFSIVLQLITKITNRKRHFIGSIRAPARFQI